MKLVRLGLAASSILWMSGVSTAQTLRPAWTAESNHAAARFGTVVSSAGDVNRDGYDDVIVSAPGYDHGQRDEGRAYLYLGSKYGLAKLPAWTTESNQANAPIWHVAAAGDVDGDGFGDVIVTSRAYSNGEYLEGIAFLYRGSPSGLEASPAWSAEGNEQAAYLGYSAAGAGDVNGDGFGDVLVGALLGDLSHVPQSEGAVFLYLGSPWGLAPSPAWSAAGNQNSSGFGSALATGDVNGDGYGDVAVGAGAFSHGQRGEGRVFLYLGSAAGLAASAAWTAEGDQVNASFGVSVAAGDVDGDGYDDVVVGNLGYDTGLFGIYGEGRILVYRGSASGPSTTPDWIVTGDQGGCGFGITLATGDLDGDGYAEVIVGAEAYDHGHQNEGRVSAFFGSALGLRTRTSWIAEGNQHHCFFGSALARAGDVNGDGLDDVIVGSSLLDAGQTSEGRA